MMVMVTLSGRVGLLGDMQEICFCQILLLHMSQSMIGNFFTNSPATQLKVAH